VGGMVDDVVFSTAMGDDVTAMSYDSMSEKLYVAARSADHGAHYVARIDLQQLPVSR